MGFWIFTLIIDLLVPFTMIGFGHLFIKSGGPKEINMIVGYRSSMSMKNKDTWKFAHIYCGKLWRCAGWIMLPVSVGAMLFVIGRDTDTVGIYGSVLCGIQVFFMLLTIIITEKALRKHFDKQGNRKTT